MRSALVVASMLLVACQPSENDGLDPITKADFRERMAIARDQIRRDLPEAAAAELDACDRLSPGHPETLFHRARVLLMAGDEASTAEAVRLLEQSARADGNGIRAQRVLYEIARYRGENDRAAQFAAEIRERYGAVGEFELRCFDRLILGERVNILSDGDVARVGDPTLDPFLAALDNLRRAGTYHPGPAVQQVEDTFDRFPHLAGARFFYMRALVGGPVRMDKFESSELSPLSSAAALEVSQKHHEDVFDQLHPRGRVAQRLLRGLSWTQMAMGEYEDAIAMTDALLASPTLPSADRPVLAGQKAIALFKLERYEQCASTLRDSLEEFPNALRLEHLWVLRIARQRLGDSEDALRRIFPLRRDLTEPLPSLKFIDIGPEMGIDRRDGYGPNAWGDADGDGDLDLFVSGGDSFSSLFRNDGSRFVEVTESAGLGSTDSGFSATFVDYDNDGWKDIYIGRNGWIGPGRNTLFRNRGDGTFEDVTEASGLGDPADTFVHTWSDVDRDGDLDVFLCHGITRTGAVNRLYRNNGDGTFSDVTAASGLEEPAGTQTIGAAFGDFDKDGWPDLFVSGSFTYNRLYRNRGDGTFEDVAIQAGVDGISHFSSGYVSFFADFDNDTWPDILRTSLAPWPDVLLAMSDAYPALPPAEKRRLADHSPRLYLNNRDGTFTDVSATAGLVHPTGTMGAMVGDLDNDGWMDIYLGTGSPLLSRLEPDRFYHANGDGTFSDRTFASGLGNLGKGHGITMIDVDGDGDLEVYAAEGGMVHGDLWNNAFYRNDQTTGNHWFHVDLVGVQSNRDGIGTKVTISVGQRTMYREAQNGEGFGCSNSPTVEFGIGGATSVDRLVLEWPSGTHQVFENLAADQRIFIREGSPWSRISDGTQ